jgi:predicted GIY-YIG superfamily endonuclease
MYYVYLIRSTSTPEKTYVGFTQDLKRRLADHNTGQSLYTSKFIP